MLGRRGWSTFVASRGPKGREGELAIQGAGIKTSKSKLVFDSAIASFEHLEAEVGHQTGHQLVDWVCSESTSARDFVEGAESILYPQATARTAGAHLTSFVLADYLVSRLDRRAGVILDPACGCGHLLTALAEWIGPQSPADWHGWDIDRESVAVTRIALWVAAGRVGLPADYRNVRTLDALTSSPPIAADVIVANPPFVGIRQLVRERGPDYPAELRGTIPQLFGNFDLFVAFLLKMSQWLGERGEFGVIVPAPFWSAEYASKARAALSPLIREVHDFESRILFRDAAVSTNILIGSADNSGDARVYCEADPSQRPDNASYSAHLGGLETGFPTRDSLSGDFIPLGDLAEVVAGTPGYDAQRTKKALREERDGVGESLPFVVSRCIKPYKICFGDVRFLRDYYQRPVLPTNALSAGKRALFSQKKVLVKGVGKSLVASRDDHGVAMGVGVYAIRSTKLAPELILALLNSRVVSSWYRGHFRGRELSGGYFAVNCNQLRKIPVPRVWVEGERDGVERIVDLVRNRENPSRVDRHVEFEKRIEELIGNLFV